MFEKKRKEDLIDKDDTSASEEESSIEYCDSSSGEESCITSDIIEGDFVVVKITGKTRELNYIARVDIVADEVFEGLFLRKVPSKLDTEDCSFIPNEKDPAFFTKEDIIHKLPQPKSVGGSARRSFQLVFHCNLKKWNIA